MAKVDNWPVEVERAMQMTEASDLPRIFEGNMNHDPYAPKRRLASIADALERDILASPPPDDQPDALIRGLLTHLPPPGDVWPETKRKLWLELVAGSFKLIYQDEAPTAP